MTQSILKYALALILAFVGVDAVNAAFAGIPGAARPAASPVPLAFSEFFDPTPTALEPSPKLLSLNGKRVRMTGYMVKMESPMAGAFYLAAHPVSCDEEGAGTADLPPACVRVIVRGARHRLLGFVGRPLIVTGILQIGPEMEADGQVSRLRLILDGPEPTPARSAQARSAVKTPKLSAAKMSAAKMSAAKMSAAKTSKTKETH